MRFFSIFAALISLGITSASADTLDFTETAITGYVGSSVINLTNASITSSGSDIFIGAGFGESNGLGIVCASPSGSGCEEDMRIDFASDVVDLSFSSFATATGDLVSVSAWLDGAFLGNAVITTDTVVDFSGFGTIDSLYFADASSSAGIGWGDFSFTAVAAIPVPAGFPLLLSGAVALGWISRKRKC